MKKGKKERERKRNSPRGEGVCFWIECVASLVVKFDAKKTRSTSNDASTSFNQASNAILPFLHKESVEEKEVLCLLPSSSRNFMAFQVPTFPG